MTQEQYDLLGSVYDKVSENLGDKVEGATVALTPGERMELLALLEAEFESNEVGEEES